jgi:predicted acyltransferase
VVRAPGADASLGPRSAVRLRSVDAARGLAVAAMLLVNDPGDWSRVYPWLEHAAWNGCTLADVVFPVFLLIVGVSTVLALEPRLAAGAAAGALSRSILARAARLFVLGVALNVVAELLIPGRGFRLLGVLQRIGVCYAFAGLIALRVRGARAQWLLVGAILVGYALLLLAGGSLAPDVNLADRLDTALLGRVAYSFDALTGRAHDPEGLLSTLPAFATVVIGLRAGAWLRAGDERALWAGAAAAIALGVLAAIAIPLNKSLWTPSFVLVTAGAGLGLLALAHRLIDRRGWPAVGESLGLNAIAIYAASWIAECVLARTAVLALPYAAAAAAIPAALGARFASLVYALAFTAAWWSVAVLARRLGWRLSI